MSENDIKDTSATGSPSDDAGQQKSDATASERRAAAASAASRDVPLSTFVHLLGLSTSSQVSLIESKVDMLTSKVATALLKLERLTTDLTDIKADAAIDRIDFQLNDIRALLKKIAPMMAAGSTGTAADAGDGSKSPASRAKVMKSESAKPETKIVEQDNLADLSHSADSEAFQVAEGQRVRNQTKEGA